MWDVGAGNAETVLAEARKALFVMVGFLAILWIIQIANWADHYQLTFEYGIRPRDAASLPDILTAPFLHFNWAHIEGNSGPLFIFGFLAAYRGVTEFFGVTVLVILTSGLGAWIFESPSSVSAGAERSGVRVFRLHHGPRVLRPAPDRHADRCRHGALLRVPVHRAAPARWNRVAGAHRRAGRRHSGWLDIQGTPDRRPTGQGVRPLEVGVGRERPAGRPAQAARRSRPVRHMSIIDAHHHVWDLSVHDQPFLDQPGLEPLRRNFLLADLEPEAAAQGVTSTVVVQTITKPEETPNCSRSQRPATWSPAWSAG